jgi:hypothetical protein
LYVRTGFRFTGLIGAVICIAGALMFAFLRQSVSLGLVALAGSIVGLGFGFVATSVIVAVQSTVGWDRRGVVTGANMFGRTIGGALGVAAFGSIANSSLIGWLRNPPAAVATQLPHGANAASLILGGSSAIHDHAASDYVREGLFLAVHHVFFALVIVAAILATAVAMIPRRVVPISFASSSDSEEIGSAPSSVSEQLTSPSHWRCGDPSGVPLVRRAHSVQKKRAPRPASECSPSNAAAT